MGESGEALGSSLIVVVVIILGAILMFVFPLVEIAKIHDNESLAMAQKSTSEFVNLVVSKGKLTQTDYDAYVQKINSGVNSYDIEIEIHISDPNPGKKTQDQLSGDTSFYTVYDSQVKQELESHQQFNLKENDYIIVYYKNTNTTMYQSFLNVLYKITGNSSYLSGQVSSPVMTTGM